MSLNQIKVGPLWALTSVDQHRVPSKTSEASEALEAKSSEAVIFLHGAGASMSDLAGLTDALPSLKQADLYFLNAPFEMVPGMPMYVWFEVGQLVERLSGGRFNPELLKNFVPEGLGNGRKALDGALAELSQKYSSFKIIGFSQGGMMGLDYALRHGNISHLALLSTSICDWPTLEKNVESLCKGTKIFQSHGKNDSVLPFDYGDYLAKFLSSHCSQYVYEVFSGGHEIPLDILNKLDVFLR